MKILMFLVPALLLAAGTAAAEKRYVARSGIRLLSKPAAFSKALATLGAGQLVLAGAKTTRGYHPVVVKGGKYDGKKGYVSRLALIKARPRIGTSTVRSRDASAEEVAAATKGFNKQVEAKYRQENAKLDYDQLDKLIERTAEDPDSAAHKAFRKEGKLGEYAQEQP